MANILFASNNIAHFVGTGAGSVAGTFDESRVPYSILLAHQQTTGSPEFAPSASDVTWFHFNFYTDEIKTDFDDILFFDALDSGDRSLFQIWSDGGNTQEIMLKGLLTDGSTTKSTVADYTLGFSLMHQVDIRYEVSAVKIQLDIYINGARIISHLYGANGNSYGKPVRFTMGGAFATVSGAMQHMSEIIISDESTINARLDMVRPASAGAHTDWDGLLTTLGDDDRTSGMTTLVAAQRQTMIMNPYTGAANISNVVAVSTSTRGLNAPTKLAHTVRMGAVDYDGVEHDIPFEAKYLITDYNINPATSLAWTSADLATAEFGFKSVA